VHSRPRRRALRYLYRFLDVLGVILAAGGLIGLAFLVHPFLAATVAGAACLVVAFVFEPRKAKP